MSFVSAATQGFPFETDNDLLVLDHNSNSNNYNNYNHDPEPRNQSAPTNQRERSSIDSTLLSPFLSRADSESLSPTNHFETPAGSTSGPSHYQSSDYSDFEEDPFFGVSFVNPGAGTPSFLDDQSVWDLSVQNTPPLETTSDANKYNNTTYPLTPEQTASIHTVSPRSDQRATLMRPDSNRLPDSISPQELQKPFRPAPLVIPAPQLTPSQSGSGRSSEDGLAPAPVDMRCQSPRVTISVWDKDNTGPVHTVERTFEDSPTTERGGIESAGDLISSASHPRDSTGRWQRDPNTGLAGLDPRRRPDKEIASINEIVSRQVMEEKNAEVGNWLTNNTEDVAAPPEKTVDEINAIEEDSRRSNDGVPLGDTTENRYLDGQTYYNPNNDGQMTDQDYETILKDRNWADAPILHSISDGRYGRHQPQTSQAAIERFERMCRDNDSIISRAATWGTRRRSLPSVIDLDIEGITSGSFLKKLSISRGSGEKGSRHGSLLKDLRGLVRRPSASGMRKRSRSGQGEALFQEQPQPEEPPQSKRDSITHLSPTSRTSSWGKKQTPSINSMLVTMGQNVASIGATHSRSGSISNLPTTPSKSPLAGLSVKTSLRRPRSKSDLSKPSASTETHSNLVGLWRKTGGPPVASISKAYVEPDEDEDEDDDFYEDNDMKMNPNIIDDITPNFVGFQKHIQILNPGLHQTHGYLVDRIAHQQIIRYKQLLNCKVKHLNQGAHCPCGALCIALGGLANLLDSKGDARELDPLSTGFEDDDITPTEGAINQESFPTDIPMPPTPRLPAEFECQLCYQKKKFSKPSDWTKHVHEDIQPFTCTWDKCRDPKIFKRKADWVRHENEGHRHLEWWTCDVEDCRHVCYRRDNFLQHLVREHKFQEPKLKTKAALKKAISVDPTWQKVEQCHRETTKQPHEEPCRFCGKQFPTWKKLTVHLAKHMEQISLPVLRLVAAKAKELDADTIISPVQDPPPRHDIPLPGDQRSPAMRYPTTPQQQAHLHQQQQMIYQQSPQHQGPFMYPVQPPQQFQPTFYSPQFESIEQSLHPQPMSAGPSNQVLSPDLQVRSAGFVQGPGPFMAMPQGGMEQFQPLNALGLQNIAVSQMGGQMGGQMAYDGMMDPSSGNGSPFSGHESLSNYSHSPHQNTGNWDDRQVSGFM
ncbi:hypothetical protein PT974_09015 [Cladobotryum mycophilum]|uniref:C2H2-type domain-containing protein n=1 Tax=Cladobotryum mycophilum TaxID=491253 RepID=A0ABR0SF46_9HYPO